MIEFANLILLAAILGIVFFTMRVVLSLDSELAEVRVALALILKKQQEEEVKDK